MWDVYGAKEVTMMNIYGVAATIACGSALALLADRPAWAMVFDRGKGVPSLTCRDCRAHPSPA